LYPSPALINRIETVMTHLTFIRKVRDVSHKAAAVLRNCQKRGNE
jgi:hypothetical protein